MNATVKKKSIPENIRQILSAMEREGNMLKGYPQQLDRPVYEQLNKVLEALGGKWKRGKGHVFACSDDELADKLENAIESGEYDCPRGHEFLPTPAALAAQLIAKAEFGTKHSVLEPSAGDGALLRALFERLKHETDVEMRLRVIELMPENKAKLEAANIIVHGTDFETHDFKGEKFDRVIMNPPFRKAPVHILKAYDLLEDGGRLVAIAPAGVTFRQDRLYKQVRMLAEESGWIEELPEGSFHEQGTDVNTVMLCIEK